MKLKTFALASAAAMAATSLAVWSATDPSRSDGDAAASEAPSPVIPEPAAPDRSTFKVGKTLMMEGRLGHPVLPAAADSETYVFIDVSADDAARAAKRVPLDLSIVIDKSGSMKGKRLENAVAAARTAVSRLRDGDAVSILAYNTRTQVVVPRTVIGADNRARLDRALRRVRAGGDTCISCGIQAAMNLLGRRPEMVQRILLLSDGQATAGVRDVAGFRSIAESCRRMGASITTIGVDVDYNERIMTAIARESNGGHHFVRDAAGLPPVFDQEMESLARTVANGAELALDLAPGVFVAEVFDRAFTRRGNRVVVPMGAFSAGDHKTLLVRLTVPRGPAGERPVADAHLSYDDLAGDRRGSCDGKLVARLTGDASELSPLDGLVSSRLTQSETAKTLEEANDLFRRGRAGEARRLVQRTRGKLSKRRARAHATLDPMAAPAAEARFGAADKALGGATGGFTKGADGDEAQAQIRSNAEQAADNSL